MSSDIATRFNPEAKRRAMMVQFIFDTRPFGITKSGSDLEQTMMLFNFGSWGIRLMLSSVKDTASASLTDEGRSRQGLSRRDIQLRKPILGG